MLNRLLLILFIAGAFILALAFMGPIAQDPSYHEFADQRMFLGIPNFLDVTSNLPFLIIGLAGFVNLLRNTLPGWFKGILITVSLYTGIALTFFGSVWYHLEPTNQSLLWDRLPLTIIFSSFLAFMVFRIIGTKGGYLVYYTLILLGICSVLYWYYTESIGQGDLRPYVFVQFFPLMCIPVMLWFYRKRVEKRNWLFAIFIFYLGAKACEMLDDQIWTLGQLVSGHTLKHLLASVSAFYLVKWARV
ncbi:MAG: hypothetical protein IH946_02205 [Bacteroidetes bacterium]|nr:hypothetical protein [Bacteroidota bacterium]